MEENNFFLVSIVAVAILILFFRSRKKVEVFKNLSKDLNTELVYESQLNSLLKKSPKLVFTKQGTRFELKWHNTGGDFSSQGPILITNIDKPHSFTITPVNIGDQGLFIKKFIIGEMSILYRDDDSLATLKDNPSTIQILQSLISKNTNVFCHDRKLKYFHHMLPQDTNYEKVLNKNWINENSSKLLNLKNEANL